MMDFLQQAIAMVLCEVDPFRGGSHNHRETDNGPIDPDNATSTSGPYFNVRIAAAHKA
ncbi:MAG TPA: hypothetical protein VKU02_09845 [Gemmataceae bacterium]|nr:hypothetical protein [Gemmataceae bacterium]